MTDFLHDKYVVEKFKEVALRSKLNVASKM
jgi:hypothetical protein